MPNILVSVSKWFHSFLICKLFHSLLPFFFPPFLPPSLSAALTEARLISNLRPTGHALLPLFSCNIPKALYTTYELFIFYLSFADWWHILSRLTCAFHLSWSTLLICKQWMLAYCVIFEHTNLSSQISPSTIIIFIFLFWLLLSSLLFLWLLL